MVKVYDCIPRAYNSKLKENNMYLIEYSKNGWQIRSPEGAIQSWWPILSEAKKIANDLNKARANQFVGGTTLIPSPEFVISKREWLRR